jgi:4a-hydroxytetrahydrobiopterin dehydratase
MAGWRDDGEALIRDLEFANFAEAMSYVNEVAEVAERENHHPDIAIHGWNKVRLSLFTHSENRITDADPRDGREDRRPGLGPRPSAR